MLLRLGSGFLLLAVVTSSMAVAAQENQTAPKAPCITKEEPIYRPGTDGVTPPQPQAVKDTKRGPDVRTPYSLELLVNSDGRVCEARVLTARDESAAREAADYISEHWTFKPATRKGKPVAVKLTMNFTPK